MACRQSEDDAAGGHSRAWSRRSREGAGTRVAFAGCRFPRWKQDMEVKRVQPMESSAYLIGWMFWQGCCLFTATEPKNRLQVPEAAWINHIE